MAKDEQTEKGRILMNIVGWLQERAVMGEVRMQPDQGTADVNLVTGSRIVTIQIVVREHA